MALLDLGVRGDFPLLAASADLHYLDTAATAQQPATVLAAEQDFYRHQYGPVHRGMYDLATAATEAYEQAREQLRAFINAAAPAEIVVTASATAALNSVAHIESVRLQPGDEIILSRAEHHSVIVPWQRVAARTGATLVWVDLTPHRDRISIDDLRRKVNARTKIVALTHASNVLGSLLPVAECAALAHAHGARFILDATQTAGRRAIDVQALGVDYAVFSGHKLYGPTGTGWLYGRAEWLAAGTPLMAGGGTVAAVTTERTTWAAVPQRYEAGSPNVAGVVGLAAALTYLQHVGLSNIQQHDEAIAAYALATFSAIPGLTVHGPLAPRERVSIFAFTLTVAGMPLHSHDVVALLNDQQVAVRGGHHCAQPLLAAIGVPELARASAGIYTTPADIDALASALRAVAAVFHRPRATVDTRATS